MDYNTWWRNIPCMRRTQKEATKKQTVRKMTLKIGINSKGLFFILTIKILFVEATPCQ